MSRLAIIDQPMAASGDGTLRVTHAAWPAIRKFLDQNGAKESNTLRLGVRGGGCSGLEYVLKPETTDKAGDVVVEGPDGLRLVVDGKSILFLQGTLFDYKAGLMESGFKIVNPQAKSTCSCGSSFSA
ncbi:MAG: iron-sulfur cluster assembly accessory protein [Deltaproteobacteria bacterium]|nr:iron-sulfur cluster assembly accessory protein [Deltaproteobacteria bacterium]